MPQRMSFLFVVGYSDLFLNSPGTKLLKIAQNTYRKMTKISLVQAALLLINFAAATVVEPVCPGDFILVKTVYSEAAEEKEAARNLRGRMCEESSEQQSRQLALPSNMMPPPEQAALSPITIVRQGDSYVEFKVGDYAWFADEVVGNIRIGSNQPLHIFTLLTAEIGRAHV